MLDWFEWNGVRSTVYGVHVSEQPPITLPAERVVFTDVPGRSGSLTVTEGPDVYEDMTLTVHCFISNSTDITALTAWLRGGGKVTFANRPGGFYYARIINQISFEKVLHGSAYRSFAVNFRCKPFFYLTPTGDITVNATGAFVTNPGNAAAEPVLTLTGSGDITLLVNTQIIQLTSITSGITLNSELQEAYYGSTAMNEKMSGEFPVFQPGVNSISWSGNVTGIVIIPNWRTL